MSIWQQEKNKRNLIVRSSAFIIENNRRQIYHSLSSEWMLLTIHFYGHLIKQGMPLSKVSNLTLKQMEVLLSLQTKMIRGDILFKNKQRKDKEEKDTVALLEKLKKMGK